VRSQAAKVDGRRRRESVLRRTIGGRVLWLILLLALVIIVFGLGFVVKTLFYVAIALALIWLILALLRAIRGR
jgi:cobalamin biosynthesis protein CobD/CbiB